MCLLGNGLSLRMGYMINNRRGKERGKEEKREGEEEGEVGGIKRERRKIDRICFEPSIVLIEYIPFTFTMDNCRILQNWEGL